MREKAPGRWELRVDLGRDAVTGERQRTSRAFHGGKRAAERALRELCAEVESRRTAGTTATFGWVIDQWLAQIEPTRSPTTMLAYRANAKNHVLPALGSTPVRDITAHELDQMYRRLGAQGLSPASVRRVHALISAALHQAEKWDWVDHSVARRASPPAVRRADVHVPPIELAVQLLDDATERDPEVGMMIRLAVATGARRGELCGLRWSDVDLAAGVLRIQRAVIDVQGRVIVKDTKTHAARTLSLDGATGLLLGRHLEYVADRAQGALVELGVDSFMFSPDPSGTRPYRPERLTKAWASVCRARGVAGVRLHDLRHLHATQLIAAGVDVRTVANRLGHAQTSTTLNIYAHALDSADRAAADVMGRLLERPTG